MNFTTFAATPEEVTTAIEAGATHLIIENPTYSIRCYTPPLYSIPELTAHAKNLAPTIQLSLNCDLLPHTQDFQSLEALIPILEKTEIQTIRLQDPSLRLFFTERLPHLTYHLATETGNNNQESIQYHSQFFAQQTLTNELPIAEIKKTTGPIELQVQGPILLQYSPRRFLTGYFKKDTLYQSIPAQAHEYPGRTFRFFETPHGHFMYLYFDRCLLSTIPNLISLNLASWLIDARGESLSYLSEFIKTYIKAYKENAPQNPPDLPNLRPQKPGFFKINRTDQSRPKKSALMPNDIHIGTIIDCIPKHSYIVELIHPLPNAPLTILTPEGKRFAANTPPPPSPQRLGNKLVQFPWQKGVQVKCKLLTQKSSESLAEHSQHYPTHAQYYEPLSTQNRPE